MALETFLVSRFMVFTLVLARTARSDRADLRHVALPRQVRALLAVTISLLVTPVFLNTSLPPLKT